MYRNLRVGGGPRQHKSVPEGFLGFNFLIMDVFPLPGKYKSTKSDQQDAVPGRIQAIYACCWLLTRAPQDAQADEQWHAVI